MYDVEASLRTIPWHSISALKGTCSHVPDAILALVSNDPGERKSAYWSLDNRVIVQGGLFEGAFYVVPFLIQICRGECINGRGEAFELLIELASGASSFDKQVRFTTVTTPFPYYVPDANASCTPLTIAVRFAVACGLDSIIPFAVSSNETERRHSHALIELFPEFAGDISERLLKLASSVEVDQIRKDVNRLINALRA